MKNSLVTFLLLFAFTEATADGLSNFGLGGRDSARVGTHTAEPDNPWAAYSNPALLAARRQTGVSLSSSVGKVNYRPFRNVLVNSQKYRTGLGPERDARSDFRLPSSSMQHWSLGWVYPFELEPLSDRRAGLGLTLSGPFSTIRQMSASSPYAFRSLKYGAQDNQLKAVVGASVELLREKLYWGTGLSFFMHAAGNGEALIVPEDPTGRLEMTVALNTHLVTGLYASLGSHGLSLVFRQGIRPTLKQKITGRMGVGADLQSVDIPMLLQASLYSEPHRLEFGWQYRSGKTAVAAGVALAFWSGFTPPFLNVEAEMRGGERATTEVPDLNFKNTLSPRVSIETPLGYRLNVLAGYRYEPAVISDPDLGGVTNLIDSDAHVFGLGLEYSLETDFFAGPLRLGAHGQVHFLSERDISKIEADAVGAPGYTFSGSAYYLGLSLGTSL